MKKILKIVIIAAALMMWATTDGHAQVFIMEDEHNLRPTDPEEVLGWPVNPQNGNGTATDDYVPIGDGLLMLASLSSVYLLCKRKEEK